MSEEERMSTVEEVLIWIAAIAWVIFSVATIIATRKKMKRDKNLYATIAVGLFISLMVILREMIAIESEFLWRAYLMLVFVFPLWHACKAFVTYKKMKAWAPFILPGIMTVIAIIVAIVLSEESGTDAFRAFLYNFCIVVPNAIACVLLLLTFFYRARKTNMRTKSKLVGLYLLVFAATCTAMFIL